MADGEDSRLEGALEAFRDRWRQAAPFREDRERAADLALEARPAVEALLAAADGGGDLDSLEHHEGLAMVTLLGRRAAELDVTPTAALALVPAIEQAMREVAPAAASPDGGDGGDGGDGSRTAMLQALCMEGYCASRDERQLAIASANAAAAQVIVPVTPRCLALLLGGLHEPERLGEVVDRLGRAMLDRDAAACIVDLGHLREPTAERAAEVFGAHATARMLGAQCVFAVGDEAWLQAARRAHVDLDVLTVEPSFDGALLRALSACGLALRRAHPLRHLLGGDR